MATALEEARAALLQQLQEQVRDERVLWAMAQVPRECFVPPDMRHLAYTDMPLPISEGQTISQPLMVAIMTEALGLRGTEHVLEVGSGSGYQAALLSLLARDIITVERHLRLAQAAAERLQELGYHNVTVHLAFRDVLGWPEGAPYDAIVVTAAAPRLPLSLVDQLAIGGCLVIPIGSAVSQDLERVTRLEKGLRKETLVPCRFVPLIGPEAWPEPVQTP